MPQTAQITCINKDDQSNVYERITHIGGYVTSHWRITRDDAIRFIENNEWRFYVTIDSRTTWIMVATSPDGKKYIKTEADPDQPDSLLSLPECP